MNSPFLNWTSEITRLWTLICILHNIGVNLCQGKTIACQFGKGKEGGKK